MICNDFIYDDCSSKKYGIGIYSISNSNNHSTNDEQTNEIISKTSSGNSWDLHNVEYSSPLSFKVTICNDDGTPMNGIKENTIKKWLCRNSRKWLSINNEDYLNILFYCRFCNPTREIFGENIVGLTFTVICDSPFGYSYLKTMNYSSTVTNTIKTNINNTFMDTCVYPKITITNASGNISIENTTTDEKIEIENCVLNEVITIVCGKDMITTTGTHDVCSDWNKNTISFIDGVNQIVMTGSFTMKIEYRIPMRIGG